jgi:hypothetical protein
MGEDERQSGAGIFLRLEPGVTRDWSVAPLRRFSTRANLAGFLSLAAIQCKRLFLEVIAG